MISRLFKKYDILLAATCAYILLPIVLFFVMWTKWFYAIALIVFLVWFFCARRSEFTHDGEPFYKSEKIKLAAVLVILFVWVLLSGSGGVVAQTNDYEKHNAILYDLISNGNPVILGVPEGDSGMLVYYIAYYLPSAVIGKLFGFAAATSALMLWTYAGIVIGVMWLFRVLKKVSVVPAVVLILFSGFDIFGVSLVQGIGGLAKIAHKEWWLSPFYLQISGFTVLLDWVPHMFVPALVITALIYFYKDFRMPDAVYLIVAASFLWSPFICLGLMPFFAYLCVRRLKNYGIRNIISLPAFLCCALMTAVMVLYITANSASGLDVKFVYFAYETTPYEFWSKYLVFALFEFGILYAVLNKTCANRRMLYFATLVLVGITLIHGGEFNDFCMRVTIPAFIVLFVIFTEVFTKSIANRRIITSIVCIITVSLMSYTAINDIAARLIKTEHLFGNTRDELKSVANYPDYQRQLRDQYISVGYEETAFSKFVMK